MVQVRKTVCLTDEQATDDAHYMEALNYFKQDTSTGLRIAQTNLSGNGQRSRKPDAAGINLHNHLLFIHLQLIWLRKLRIQQADLTTHASCMFMELYSQPNRYKQKCASHKTGIRL